MKPSYITVVSGLPRSGTSMMMKMLEAGGMSPLTDNLRAADADNPNGYYEFERVKKLPQGDSAWLADAQGKVVKIVAVFLPYLPPQFDYRIIFMQRSVREVTASQHTMLEHRGNSQQVSAEELIALFQKHLNQVDAWFKTQPRVKRLDVNYNDLLRNPAPYIENIRLFLDLGLDSEKMGAIVDPNLYRQRVNPEAPQV
ncbi:MAG: sulfotransferase family protein [Chloroflexi bacterium]|nr:sulfotransferase family protein [Chloroflexota bacterium]